MLFHQKNEIRNWYILYVIEILSVGISVEHMSLF